jgi:hypothetical protein
LLNTIVRIYLDNHHLTIKLQLVLNNRKEFVRGLLSSFYTSTKGDIVPSFKALKPTIRELETKVRLLVAFLLDYSLRMEFTIDFSSMLEYPFVANLPSNRSSLLEFSIKLRLHLRLFGLSIRSTRLKRAFLLSHNPCFV